jgi:tetratricopeptide (TPR) repeat protein
MKDKVFITNEAQKYLAKGQIDKAIAEWQKLLDNSRDGNIHNTIGDLYLRKGAEREALESFSKAAEIYRKDGFYPKAIALYTKILNIIPSNVEAIIALAKLNAEKGLIGNAVDNFFKAAEIYNRDGATEKTVKVIEKVLQLSPSDLGTRTRIAELYLRTGHRERAANEYSAVATIFLEKDEDEKAQELFQKATELDPENIPAFIGFCKLEEKSKNTSKAFEYLEKALSHDPKNKDVLFTYANLSIKTNNIDNAKKTLLKLVESAPSDIHAKQLLGGLYLDEGQHEKAWEQLQTCIDEAVNEQNWPDALELLNNFKDLHPVPVGERIVNICRTSGDNETMSKELKNLAGLYENQGSLNDALRLYKEFFALNPDDTAANQKIHEIEVSLGIAEPVKEGAPAREDPLADNLMHTHEVMKDEITPQMEENLVTNNLMDQHETVQEQTTPQSVHVLSPEKFTEKKTEADFFAKQGMNDEAVKIYESLLSASPDNEAIKNRLETLKTNSTGTEEIVVETYTQSDHAEQDAGESNLQELFNEFDNSEEREEDYELHYNAGIEYKQKGLLDEAIKEFQIVAKDPGKKLLSLRMLASCYMEKGAYPPAITEFNRIIEVLSPADAGYLDIKYELAVAYINNKDHNKAVEVFSEIQSQDSGFRDVSQKLEALKNSAQQNIPKQKRDRVSYI